MNFVDTILEVHIFMAQERVGVSEGEGDEEEKQCNEGGMHAWPFHFLFYSPQVQVSKSHLKSMGKYKKCLMFNRWVSLVHIAKLKY